MICRRYFNWKNENNNVWVAFKINSEILNNVLGGTVAQWLALMPHSNRGYSVWSLYVLPVLAWVFSGCSSFLPQSKDMQFRLIGESKKNK